MKIAYIKKRFNKKQKELIVQANGIIEEYQSDGYDLTLRQLYYRFVALDLFPGDRKWCKLPSGKWVRDADGTKNADPNYDWLGVVLNDARLAGLVDWHAIEDRTRYLRTLPHWDSPAEVVEACAGQFRVDTRSTQKDYVEVWIEKDALIGVIESVCQELDVPCFSCRGYISQSAMWRAAIRIREQEHRNLKDVTILHLGDHDPSGIDMTRDIRDRLDLFGCSANVERIALTMEQVEELQPPPNPAKITDSRCAAYVEVFGDESWELDALDPAYLTRLVEDHVRDLTDEDARNERINEQDEGREALRKLSEDME